MVTLELADLFITKYDLRVGILFIVNRLMACVEKREKLNFIAVDLNH